MMKELTSVDPEWAESLPSGCPPTDAREPQNETFYRLVGSNPPAEKDFYSFRLLYPTKHFSENECIVRAVSIWDSLEACKSIKKLPIHKEEKIAKLILPPESGLIKKTRSQNHFSWWRFKNFNPLPRCVNIDI